MNRKTWNPANNLAPPIETVEPTEWDVVGLFDGDDDTETAARFAVMAACPHHLFRSLTDLLDRAAAFVREYTRLGAFATHNDRLWFSLRDFVDTSIEPFASAYRWTPPCAWPLPNLMIGAPIATQAEADERLPELAEIPARFRFVRIEPREEFDLLRRAIGDPDLMCTCGSHAAVCGLDGQWWCDSCGGEGPKELRSPLDLVEIAGGPGPEQLRLVQQIGRQVLDAQTRIRCPLAEDWECVDRPCTPCGYTGWSFEGPALSIVTADVCSGCGGWPQGQIGNRSWYCEDCNGTGATGRCIVLPTIHVGGRNAQVWNQQPVGWSL